MRVIKKGRIIKGFMWVTCKKCEAELEIQAEDLKPLSTSPFANNTTYYYICPCCLRRNYINYSDLSEDIRFDLNNFN